MTPKEKAKELFDKMDFKHYRKIHSRPKSRGLPISMYDSQRKQCALLCVKEIKKNIKNLEIEYDEDFYHAYGIENYWSEVELEINKL